MSRNNHETIEKLRRQASGERAVGNIAAADSCERKIAALERNHSLVPVPKADDIAAERRRVEAAWEAIPPSTLVVIDVIEPGLQRAGRRPCTMEIALPLLKSERARFVGRADADFTYPPQATTANTPPLFVPDAKQQLFI
jgi:hypothetical protein